MKTKMHSVYSMVRFSVLSLADEFSGTTVNSEEKSWMKRVVSGLKPEEHIVKNNIIIAKIPKIDAL
ncbi:MAG: hypothetical protein LBT43_23690 [Prevotella sp.]|jgi:hypothetical protein|nr:hypothetical protein [Prevotella sp.]